MVSVKKILCPTDFSPPAARALDCATQLARHFDADLLLLHVVPPSAYPLRNLGTVTGFPNLREEIHKRVTDEMAALVGAVQGVRVRSEIAEGAPHDQILAAAAANGADLIVMATHGHTGLKHALVGSTAERVVRLSECPVLTLRAPAEQ